MILADPGKASAMEIYANKPLSQLEASRAAQLLSEELV